MEAFFYETTDPLTERKRFAQNKVKEALYSELETTYPNGGIYIITFPCGKQAIGKGRDLRKEFTKVFKFLFSRSLVDGVKKSWHFAARMENPFLKLEDLLIDVIPVEKREEEIAIWSELKKNENIYNKKPTTIFITDD